MAGRTASFNLSVVIRSADAHAARPVAEAGRAERTCKPRACEKAMAPASVSSVCCRDMRQSSASALKRLNKDELVSCRRLAWH